MTKKALTKNRPTLYRQLLADIKTRIREGQTRAMWAANAEMVATYWDVGRILCERQSEEGWGAGVLPRLEKDLRNDLSEVKGFSARNMRLMTQFYKEYQDVSLIWQQAVAKLPTTQKGHHPVVQIPWSHNVILMQKVKDRETRLWYMEKILEQSWGRDTLTAMIKSQVHKRQGKASSNFELRLPAPQSDLALQTLKDPYIFDFATIAEPFR